MTASEKTENLLVFCKVGVHQKKDGSKVLCKTELNTPDSRKAGFIERNYLLDPQSHKDLTA